VTSGVGGVLPCIQFFFFQAEDGIRVFHVTGVQTCALPILVVGRRDDPRPPAIRGPYRAAMRPASHSGGPAYGAAPASGIYQAEALVTASPKGQLRRVWGRTGRTARG